MTKKLRIADGLWHTRIQIIWIGMIVGLNLTLGLGLPVVTYEFYNQITRHCVDVLHVDPTLVFAGGWSNGAAMSIRLIQTARSVLDYAPRAIFLHSANYPDKENEFTTFAPEAEPVPVLAMHGKDDPLSPFAGGEVGFRKFGKAASRGKSPSFSSTLEILINQYREHGIALQRVQGPKEENGLQITDYYDPESRVVIKGVAVRNNGHPIPIRGGNAKVRSMILGITNGKVDGPEIVCKWLHQLHARRSVL